MICSSKNREGSTASLEAGNGSKRKTSRRRRKDNLETISKGTYERSARQDEMKRELEEAMRGMDGDWLDFVFGGVGCVLRGLRGDCYTMRVRRKSNRLWG